MKTIEWEASKIFAVLGNPFRIRLVLALWAQEGCVCHLEALLRKRQAYISQHLMALREAKILETRREGKFIYYRLTDPAIMGLIQAAGVIAGLTPDKLPNKKDIEKPKNCCCPHCTTGLEKNGIMTDNQHAALEKI